MRKPTDITQMNHATVQPAECLTPNTARTGDDLRNEADLRLDAARQLLMGMGAMPARHLQTEDAQAACTAAALLIGDSVTLTDAARVLAEKEARHV